MPESFKLSTEHTQKATLGCGTLILIALIVAIFSNSGARDVERGVDGLRNDIQELKKSIDAQSQQIREVRDALKKHEPGPSKAAEAVPKNLDAFPKNRLETDEPKKKSLP